MNDSTLVQSRNFLEVYVRHSNQWFYDRICRLSNLGNQLLEQSAEILTKEITMSNIEQSMANNSGQDGVGAGLIIAADNCQYEFLRFLGEKCNISAYEDKHMLFTIGPNFCGHPWADCIRAAGNYVRHAPEWREKIRNKCINECSEGPWDRVQTDLVGVETIFEKKSGAYQTVTALVGSGLSLDMIFDRHIYQYFRLAKHLGLLAAEEAAKRHTEWVTDVKEYYRLLGHI